MSNNEVFSWAENANGMMVHIDSVPNGLACHCRCPHCKEQLLARHDVTNQHGFAHHSDNRGANLKICYMVILYKLAEQIIQTKKQIYAPSYYGIFREMDIKFTEIKIDSRYDRTDKQPDVIAMTEDGHQYLIEFTFDQKVQHKEGVDYHQLSCIEIDLRGQKLDTLEDFLLKSSESRKWVNNENYFNAIEERYHKTGKDVRLVAEKECNRCEIKSSCQAVMQKGYLPTPLTIENNGQKYRLCKTELYEKKLEEYKRGKEIESLIKAEQQLRLQKYKRDKVAGDVQSPSTCFSETANKQSGQMQSSQSVDESSQDPLQRSCFECKRNLSWANKKGMTNCGWWKRLHIKESDSPDNAKTCKMYARKQ